MPKSWQPFSDECPRCGCTAEVFTTCAEPEQAFADDEARCVGCGLEGYVDEYEPDEPTACIEWCEFEEDDE